MRPSVHSDISTAWLLPFSAGELATALQTMWAAFGSAAAFSEEAGLELALLDEDEMARLNESCLGCAGPTNILAFPAEEGGPAFAAESAESAGSAGSGGSGGSGGRAVGQLALSPRTVRREALLYGQDPAAHALRLMAHGLAHLLGYDHGAEMDEAAALAALAALTALLPPAGPAVRSPAPLSTPPDAIGKTEEGEHV